MPAATAKPKTPAKAKTPAKLKTAAQAKTAKSKKATAKPAATVKPQAPTKRKPTAKPTSASKPTATAPRVAKQKPGSPQQPAAARPSANQASGQQHAPARQVRPKTQPVNQRAPGPASSARTTALAAAREHRNAGIDSPFRNFVPYQPQRSEEYMGDRQLEHFRSILIQWRLELMEEVDRTVHHMQDEAANFPDPADRATQEEEFSIELRTRDRERKLIRKIDQTIDRIDERDYGYCDTCGIEIGLRRLEARPTATQCVDCKTLDEIRERQLHG